MGENRRGRVGGENKRGGGGEKEGWSRAIKLLYAPERPKQGD